MASIRQQKIAGLIQKEMSQIFLREARTICKGGMVSVTVVRVSPDLGVAKIYLSVFGVPDKDEVMNNIKEHTANLRHELSKETRHQLRKTPELIFYLDDSLDYAEEIDRLLKE